MRTFFSIIVWILAVLLGAGSIVFVFFGGAFIFSNIIILSIFVLLVVFTITFILGVLANKISKKRNKYPAIVALITVLVVAIFSGFTVFKPFPGPISKGVEPSNTKYWDLKTGSKIAYWKYDGEGEKKETPIIFVHGGPGGYIRDLDREFFSRFTKEGYDVYLYDQPGAGFSNELSLDEYSIHRYVEDIEAIRKEIKAKQIILIGQSFGGPLSSAYTAEYPQNVEKVVFTCPGGLRDHSTENSYIPKNGSEIIKAYEPSFAEKLRLSTMFNLIDTNRKAAENFVSQNEIKGFTTRMIPSIMAQSFPESYVDKIPKSNYDGINFEVNNILNEDLEKISADLFIKLQKLDTKALILKSEFDYVAWENTKDYREAFKNNNLIYIKDSGHILWGVNKKDTYDTISAFLLNKELPLPEYKKDENPCLQNK